MVGNICYWSKSVQPQLKTSQIKIRHPTFSCDFAKQFVNYINLGLNFSWTNKTIGFTCCPRLSQKKWWIRISTEKGQSYLSGPRFNFRLLTNEIDIDDDDLHDDVGSEVTTKSCWTILSGIKEGWGCCNFFDEILTVMTGSSLVRFPNPLLQVVTGSCLLLLLG